MYKNNGELACQMCSDPMTAEDYSYCNICSECRDWQSEN